MTSGLDARVIVSTYIGMLHGSPLLVIEISLSCMGQTLGKLLNFETAWHSVEDEFYLLSLKLMDDRTGRW